MKKVVKALAGWSSRHPIGTLIVVSLLAVIINCYPVVFCGKSFVSPACAPDMMFDTWPPLPGMDSKVRVVNNHVSDASATIFWDVPAAFIERRSILEYGELPLWNRYSRAGSPLLGQAISMFGDPLHLIVLLGNGSSEAWDIKFIMAKLLFSVGFGWLIWKVFGSRPLALLYAVIGGAYCGAFSHIENHPVFFVLSYTPWILLSGLMWLAPDAKHRLRWGLVWLVANFSCFNAGHIEVAVEMIAALNLAVLVYAWTRCRSIAEGARVLGMLLVGTLLFVGLTAPVWLSFLAALPNTFSLHMDAQVNQLSPMFFSKLFDDLFYSRLTFHARGLKEPMHIAFITFRMAGSSLLILSGCVLAALRWREYLRNGFFWVNVGALFLWGGFIFGWVPDSFILSIPLLNRVHHINTDFSYLMVFHLTLLSAFGFLSLARESNFARARKDMLWLLIVFAAIFLSYELDTTHEPSFVVYFLYASAGAVFAPWLYILLKERCVRIPLAGWLAIVLLGFLPIFRYGLFSGGNRQLLTIPGPRAVMNPPIPSIQKIKEDTSEPFRVTGLKHTMSEGDYYAIYGLESYHSCQPLSNGPLMYLLKDFPGTQFLECQASDVRDITKAHSLLNMLNVKYLLAEAPNLLRISSYDGYPPKIPAGYACVYYKPDARDFIVLLNKQAWPRAFFADRIVPVASLQQFSDYLQKNGQRPFVAIEENEIAARPQLKNLISSGNAELSVATHYVLRPNSTAFDIHVPRPGVVFLCESQSLDFIATANGVQKEVLTANEAFKGIYVDRAGDYHIEFKFQPRYWGTATLLFWSSVGGVLVIMTGSALRRKVKRKAVRQG